MLLNKPSYTLTLFLMLQPRNLSKQSQSTKRAFQLYGCVVTSRDMVSHKDPTRQFDKVMHVSSTISGFLVSPWWSVITTFCYIPEMYSTTYPHFNFIMTWYNLLIILVVHQEPLCLSFFFCYNDHVLMYFIFLYIYIYIYLKYIFK